jgi:hypothetical protein
VVAEGLLVGNESSPMLSLGCNATMRAFGGCFIGQRRVACPYLRQPLQIVDPLHKLLQWPKAKHSKCLLSHRW